MFRKHRWLVLSILLFFRGNSCAGEIPQAFVNVTDVIPPIVLDIRYYGAHNFVGRPIAGYGAPKCYLTGEAAFALKKVQDSLRNRSLSLKLYDCYRPVRAVEDFIRWARDPLDTRMKKEFYPTLNKADLFKNGYIAKRSAHSRGSAVDLTLVAVPPLKQPPYVDGQRLCECYLPTEKRFADNSIDMGTGFDCLHPLSWTAARGVGSEQQKNRFLLKAVMEMNGFINYPKEWWHYTLREEPFPGTFFDFPIR